MRQARVALARLHPREKFRHKSVGRVQNPCFFVGCHLDNADKAVFAVQVVLGCVIVDLGFDSNTRCLERASEDDRLFVKMVLDDGRVTRLVAVGTLHIKMESC